MSEILTMGEPLAVLASTESDVRLENVTHFDRYLGGAELNVAVGARRLGHSVSYVSQVGNDPFGNFVRNQIQAQGIDDQYLFVDPDHWTGHQIKDHVTHGDPAVYNYRSDSAASHFKLQNVDRVSLRNVTVGHLTGIFPAISMAANCAFTALLDRMQREGVFITFDTNLRPALWATREVMRLQVNAFARQADMVLPGITEGRLLIGTDDPEKIADFYLEGRPRVVIVKVGARGAFVKTKSGEKMMVPGFTVKHVVDTVGAGDGFALGVITALLEGKTLRSAVMRGNAIGAMQVQVAGDEGGYPSPAELAAFYQAEGVQEEDFKGGENDETC